MTDKQSRYIPRGCRYLSAFADSKISSRRAMNLQSNRSAKVKVHVSWRYSFFQLSHHSAKRERDKLMNIETYSANDLSLSLFLDIYIYISVR